jgi:protein-L-isoaspartate O-methyltransferase
MKEAAVEPSSPKAAAECSSPPVQLNLVVGDGYEGFEPGAPYDAIHVGAAMEEIPPALLRQLKPGGLFLGPVGPHSHQDFVLIKKDMESDSFKSQKLTSVRYVPLTHGYPDAGKFETPRSGLFDLDY